MKHRRRKKLGKLQSKTLTLLMAGVAFSLCRSPRNQLKILQSIPKELERVNLKSLEYGLHRLYEDKYIGLRKITNGEYAPYLTKAGLNKARIFSISDLTVPIPSRWDGKWRLVLFDIPEKFKRRRNDFRYNLKQLGFKEIQKSVFCYPYDCSAEILKIAEFLFLGKYIRYAVVEELNDDQKFLAHFQL